MKSARFALPLLFVLSLAACEEEIPAPKPDAEATVFKPEPFDLKGYCAEMCERTTKCGIESAEANAALGGKKTEEALRSVRSEADKQARTCATGCLATPVDEDNRTAALRAKRCLDQTGCSELETCLAAL